ncbi:MAG: DUF6694 family lipoprotein [Isosphaeraceae bacterium]|nr:DUF6694 family lipoprotein [Isosphaeraceae bacterium]
MSLLRSRAPLAILALAICLQSQGCGGTGSAVPGGDPNARIDATDEASLQSSLEKINASLDDAGRSKFVADCAVLILPSIEKRELLKTGLSKDRLAAERVAEFKPLQGLNAGEIAAKAEAARAEAAKRDAKAKGKRR